MYRVRTISRRGLTALVFCTLAMVSAFLFTYRAKAQDIKIDESAGTITMPIEVLMEIIQQANHNADVAARCRPYLRDI